MRNIQNLGLRASPDILQLSLLTITVGTLCLPPPHTHPWGGMQVNKVESADLGIQPRYFVIEAVEADP